jgi:protein TonB
VTRASAIADSTGKAHPQVRQGFCLVYLAMAAGFEVYSLDEIARAAYVDRSALEALVARGRLQLIPGTQFVAPAQALAAARVLRQSALLASGPVNGALFALATHGPGASPRPGGWSLGVHAAAILAVFVVGRTAAPAATATAERPPMHLVFLADPGPGGGGGGGGARAPKPASRALERTPTPAPETPSVPEPQHAPAPAPDPPPLPSRQIVAPVAHTAAAPDKRDGAVDAVAAVNVSAGPGADGGAGSGREGGNGPGAGRGLGDGENGGVGGGVYRPGSGIEPPRLLREVKGTYSEEARRANITGDVVMEVVIRSDGTVGSARVTRGLGYGLDERAVAAVRQWRFTPARRAGVPVDVAVEVAMEFNLR